MHINFEFKARCSDLGRVRAILEGEGARHEGCDRQIDVYFNVPFGRLKLRKGTIERSLIGYERQDYAAAKQSTVGLLKLEDDASVKQLEEILRGRLGVKVEVDKRREIYWIDNVKFHLDRVERLGTFIEVEAIDREGTIGIEQLKRQCDHYQQRFGIRTEDFISCSYSDLLLALPKG